MYRYLPLRYTPLCIDTCLVSSLAQIFDEHLQSVSDRKSSAAPALELGKYVVAICQARVAQCDTDMREAREGEGEGERDIPQSLVNQADFECVLCTG